MVCWVLCKIPGGKYGICSKIFLKLIIVIFWCVCKLKCYVECFVKYEGDNIEIVVSKFFINNKMYMYVCNEIVFWLQGKIETM